MKSFLFENDLVEDSLLPSPEKLKFKFLIKSKKIQKQATLNSQQNLMANPTPSTPVISMKSRINNSSTRSAPNEILSTLKNSPPPAPVPGELDNSNTKFICEFYENEDDNNIETIKSYGVKIQPKSSIKPLTEK